MKTGCMWRTAVAPEFPGHNGEVYADELKGMTVQDHAKVFKARMDGYFRQQVGLFASPNQAAHFPLVVMTCVGIETIGAYKYGDMRWGGSRWGRGKVKDRHFQHLVEDMDVEFKEEATGPDGNKRSLSDFVYKGFRNTLVHGFYGRWVRITANSAESGSWFYDGPERSLLLNVFWFYQAFCGVYDEYFEALLSCSNPSHEPLKTFTETFNEYFKLWL